jgi:predicted O-linked N-acetylglucosamine transferase (SPINDLY family)
MAHYDRLEECVGCFERAIELSPENLLARSNRVFALNYSARISPDDLRQAHREFGEWMARTFPSPGAQPPRDRSRQRLTIGYLSSDFRHHSVAHYILPVLQHHDAAAFDIHLFHTDPRQDGMTRQIRDTAATYHNVTGVDDETLRRRIGELGVDVLVELNGLTEGHRLGLLARRAAPLQVSWIGYPNITGLPTIDYRIVDAVTDPPGVAPGPSGEAGPERCYRLPGPFSVYSFSGDLPGISGPPCIEAGHVTFGSFNNLAKLNDPLIALWASLLKAVPDARLLIKNIALSCHSPRERLQQAFEAHGIAPGRVRFHGRVDEQAAHMAFFNRVDICLDSFPYNGTTTNCDSLLMGVPFVTLKGDDHRSRVGASQLTHAGLEAWIADNEMDYVRIAAGLAADPETLERWRGRLRQQLMDSPLMDAAGLTARLERAYRDMWTAE